jgi:NADH-quinone oxidoreductase subunit L
MYTLNFFLLILCCFTPLLGRRLGSILVVKLNVLFLFLSSLVTLFIASEVLFYGYSCEVEIFMWIELFNIEAPFLLYYDNLSASMLLLINIISLLVHVYSLNYLQGDPGKSRFFFFLALFTFFMCAMVISGSLLQFFLGWEGVGLSSYLLINFWYTRAEANRAAMKAIIVNRFGDFGLYLAIILVFANFKTLSFVTLASVSYLLPFSSVSIPLFAYEVNIQELICFFFFIAVIGKSAQLGLHTWLPDAMEGPTPVSALLHAATMVTAGVFLLLRICYTLEVAPTVLVCISFLGAFTAFFASSVGAFQQDIKKIIAYSTCSQLGYMVASCGLHNYGGAYFHLFNHAFFKALLFLGAGSIIHALGDEQDLRKYGSLGNFLPFTYITFLIASLSLVGAPFTSGFYSKELLLGWSKSGFNFAGEVVYWFLMIAAFFTAFYSCKIINLVFFSKIPRFNKQLMKTISESDIRITAPLFILAYLSFLSGYILYDIFMGYGTNMMGTTINPNYNFYLEAEYLSAFRKAVPLIMVIWGVASYYILNFTYHHQQYFNKILFYRNYYLIYFHPIRNFFVKKW